jgi:hypothetical protein
MLIKRQRILSIEILKLTLGTPADGEFLVERFGKGGPKTAAGLLEEMGIQIGRHQEAIGSLSQLNGNDRPPMSVLAIFDQPFPPLALQSKESPLSRYHLG